MQVEHADRHFDAEHERFYQHAVAERERFFERFGQIAAVHHRCNADGGSLAQWFDDYTIAERGQRLAARVCNGGATGEYPVRTHRQADATEDCFCEALVHRTRARVHAAADVRIAENFEISLNGAVFARRTVQHGKHDVGTKFLQQAA